MLNLSQPTGLIKQPTSTLHSKPSVTASLKSRTQTTGRWKALFQGACLLACLAIAKGAEASSTSMEEDAAFFNVDTKSWTAELYYPNYVAFTYGKANNKKSLSKETNISTKDLNTYQALDDIGVGIYHGIGYGLGSHQLELLVGLEPHAYYFKQKTSNPPQYSIQSNNALSYSLASRYNLNLTSLFKVFVEAEIGWTTKGFARRYNSLSSGLAWDNYYLKGSYRTYLIKHQKFRGWILHLGMGF